MVPSDEPVLPDHAEPLASREAAELRTRRDELFQGLPVGLYRTSPEGRLLDANPAFARMVGFDDPAELLGTDVRWLFADPAARDRWRERIAREGEVLGFETELRARNGRMLRVRDSARAVRDGTGAVAFYEGVLEDVSDGFEATRALERSQERLRSSERFLHATLDALAEHVAILNADGSILAVNAAWREFADANGWAAEAYGIGTSYLAATEAGAAAEAEAAAEVLEGLRDVLAGAREYAYAEYPCHSPRERRWFSVTVTGFLLDGVSHAVVAHENITVRRELEEQLRHAQKMEAVGRLAGGIAHDFNNLLTSILGHTGMVAEDPAVPEGVRAELEEVRRSGERAAALTQQLLAFSRKQVLQPRVLDLNQVVAGMEPMLKRLLREDVALTVSLDPRAGPVRADPNQLEQVILNLAINARDAMPEGGALRVETRRLPEAKGASRAVLTVADTGHGMDPEVAERVFEPFFTTKTDGTGLGLATVYGIVKQSGGEVEVRSEVDLGTTFRVHLPIVDARPEPLPERPRGDERPRGTETILVVEDQPAVRAFAVKALRRQGYTVLAAASGQEAIGMVSERGRPVDLLLTDVVMPGMSGPEMVRRLGGDGAGPPVIFTSGYTRDQVMTRGGAVEHIHFLPKPYSPGDLARLVRQVLDGDTS